MDFSHLDDTNFPNFNTVSPYNVKNTFDYTRWNANTKVNLINVLWNSDYANVVKFDSEKDRDKWFDSIKDAYRLTLKSNARIVPEGQIKLPLPYDVAAKYNYIYVDIPIATSDDEFIDYENEDGVRRWFFFVTDVYYSAPNTTIFQLEPDTWTNFIYNAKIKYMMLERGHAPVNASDTDKFLNNPIENNKYLLSPDVVFDDSTIVKSSKYVPFGNGRKLVCLASTVGYNQLINGELGEIANDSGFTDPTFSDTSNWYGHQLQVNGYGFSTGKNYSSMKSCVNPYNRPNADLPTSLDVYAFYADDDTFLSDVFKKCPVFIRTLEAMFVVDENMITNMRTMRFCGHEIYYVTGVDKNVTDFKLNKSMFAFDSNEQRFAKLYTYPYSYLEVSDNDGKTVQVHIENTGKIGVELFTCVAYPALDCRVFVTGINGVGSQSYKWKKLNGVELNKLIPNGDFDKLTFELGIPTYSIYMDAETSYLLNNYNGLQNEREQALTAYHNAVRSTNSDNVNSKASADTGNSNAIRSATTENTNSKNMASTAKANTDNLNVCNRNNINLTIAANTANTNSANSTSNDITSANNLLAFTDSAASNKLSLANTGTANQVTTSTTANTQNANIISSAASGVASGGMSGAGFGGLPGAVIGGVAGGILGAVTAGVTASAANSNAVITTNAALGITAATNEYNSGTVTRHADTAHTVTDRGNANRTTQTNNTNSALAGQRDNNFNTTATNANNLYNTQVANANRTLGTSTANANATKNTSYANTNRAQEVQILNAKETLRTKQHVSMRSINDAGRGKPEQITGYSGKGANWALGYNGVQFRVRTQSDSAIAQTASQFARFGYALNQIWDVDESGLNLMKNFTYWKANDIWIDVSNVANSNVANTLTNIFKNGTTVWNNPNNIGKVGIYDN